MSGERVLTVARLPPLESTHSRQIVSPPTLKKSDRSLQTYTLGNSSAKYESPSRYALKECSAGQLETWPAHRRLVVIDDPAAARSQQLVAKPKFLERLERFLDRELRCLGATEVQPSIVRLQAYREVFQYLIEDFKAYRPLLAAIKREYEMWIEEQNRRIQELEPLQQMLISLAEQCDEKVIAMRNEEKQEIREQKAENRRLLERIEALHNEQHSMEAQVSRLTEELASQYLLYRDEYDARRLLIADINELHFQREERAVNKPLPSGVEGAGGEAEDPLLLRLALKKAREDEKLASTKLNVMIADYSNVVPRRDFEQLQTFNASLGEKMDVLNTDMIKLSQEHSILLDVHKLTLQQRDEYYLECETLKRSATPRPAWSRCADYVAGGEERWKTLSEGKTSSQLVGVLLNELQGSGGGGGGMDGDQAAYFDGLGYDESVPKYLQFEGKVRNRHLSKRDCAILISDIWAEKIKHDAAREGGGRERMVEYVDVYLRQRFAVPQLVLEWAYNLRDAAHRYSSDDNIGLFLAVLLDEADEALHHSHLAAVARLRAALERLDVERGDEGTLSREDLSAALAEFFPLKDAEAVALLARAAEVQLNCRYGEQLPYRNLFRGDDMGMSGEFLEELMKQGVQERLHYVDDITQELDNKLLVSVEDLKQAILVTDPHIEMTDLDSYVSWVFDRPANHQLETQREIPTMELTSVMSRLQYGNLRRIGEKPRTTS